MQIFNNKRGHARRNGNFRSSQIVDIFSPRIDLYLSEQKSFWEKKILIWRPLLPFFSIFQAPFSPSRSTNIGTFNFFRQRSLSCHFFWEKVRGLGILDLGGLSTSKLSASFLRYRSGEGSAGGVINFWVDSSPLREYTYISAIFASLEVPPKKEVTFFLRRIYLIMTFRDLKVAQKRKRANARKFIWNLAKTQGNIFCPRSTFWAAIRKRSQHTQNHEERCPFSQKLDS